MNIRIREKAADDLDGIFRWIAPNNPEAAVGIIRRLRARIERLATPGLAQIGRPGIIEGTRELIDPPYIITYKVDEARDELIVLAVFHGARDRSGS